MYLISPHVTQAFVRHWVVIVVGILQSSLNPRSCCAQHYVKLLRSRKIEYYPQYARCNFSAFNIACGISEVQCLVSTLVALFKKPFKTIIVLFVCLFVCFAYNIDLLKVARFFVPTELFE